MKDDASQKEEALKMMEGLVSIDHERLYGLILALEPLAKGSFEEWKTAAEHLIAELRDISTEQGASPFVPITFDSPEGLRIALGIVREMNPWMPLDRTASLPDDVRRTWNYLQECYP
ncbi:MAG: hypothetical protein ACO1SV_21760 [Fimbriimonas sp.]